MIKENEEVQSVRYTIRKSIELIRDMFDADACYLYLINTEMDTNEKRDCLKKRLSTIKEAYQDHKLPYKLAKYEESLAHHPADTEIFNDIDILKYIDLVAKENKNWKLCSYDSDTRPEKYIVFKKYERDGEIRREGLTAYIVRTGKIRDGKPLIFNNAKEIVEHESTAFSNKIKGLSPECQTMIGFPLIDENKNCIGVLKVENYMCKDSKYCEDDEVVQETLNYLPLLIRLIKSSKKYFDTKSYEKLFNGIRLLDNLEEIDPKNEMNAKVHTTTLHLFYLLKRKEKVGYDEILDRITDYAVEVSKILELDTQMTVSFQKILDKTRKHEELLLFGLNDYRDHFMHQFHVFVSGYIIINEFGIEIFRSKIEDSIQFVLGKEEHVSEEDILRMWFFAAFYHDHAYILEKMETELSSFFEQVLGYPFMVKLNWETLLTKGSDFPEHLNNFIRFFSSQEGTNQEILLRNYLDSIINSHDHGVLSALLLINYNKKATQSRINQSVYAALAISLHNKAVYDGLVEGNKTGISFESFPIAFLLAYCDTAQSFGRLEKKAGIELSSYPVEFLGIETIEKQRITYKLRYTSDHKYEIPTNELLAKWSKDVQNSFRSTEYNFDIQYFKKGDDKPIYTIPFHR